jgi:hypothetical protein
MEPNDWHQVLAPVSGQLVRGQQRVTTHELLTVHLGVPMSDRASRRLPRVMRGLGWHGPRLMRWGKRTFKGYWRHPTAGLPVVQLAAKHRLPAIYATREFVDAGGLLSYAPHYPDLYRRAAAYVDKIFKGAKPTDLPVEQPTKFEMVVNLKAASALGLDVPPTLLARADEVIE